MVLVSNPLTRWFCRNKVEVQPAQKLVMEKALALMVVLMMPMSGCLMTPGDFVDDIFFDTEQFGLQYGVDNWEMANEYVKNPDNESTSITVHELDIDFSETESYNPDVWIDHFWLSPNDGSPAQVVDANASQHLLYTPQGYGAFNLRFGMVLNTGSVYWHGYPLSNNSLQDHAPFIRSAWFEFEENRETEFAELYVDGPDEASLGPPRGIRIESTVSNVADLQFDPVDVTWSIYGPDGALLLNHSEIVDYGDSVTWEGYLDEDIPFGDVTLIIEGDGSGTLSHSTRLKMDYSGFLCHPDTSRPCPR